jgi:antitoxin StbD
MSITPASTVSANGVRGGWFRWSYSGRQFDADEQGKPSIAIEMTIKTTYKQVMIEPILASSGVSISDLKKNPSAVIEAAGGFPVAVLNRNTPAAYLVPVKAWEALMDRLEDIELAEIVRQRADEPEIEVRFEDL